MINYQTLANEINTDPLTYGYAPLVAAGSDWAVADLLNAVRTGADGKPAVTVRRQDVTPSELLEAIDSRDFAASLTTWFSALCNQRAIRLINDDGTNTRVIGNLQRLITSNTQGSQTRLTAVASRNGSRAEQLFGTGTYLTSEDVARALRG